MTDKTPGTSSSAPSFEAEVRYARIDDMTSYYVTFTHKDFLSKIDAMITRLPGSNEASMLLFADSLGKACGADSEETQKALDSVNPKFKRDVQINHADCCFDHKEEDHHVTKEPGMTTLLTLNGASVFLTSFAESCPWKELTPVELRTRELYRWLTMDVTVWVNKLDVTKLGLDERTSKPADDADGSDSTESFTKGYLRTLKDLESHNLVVADKAFTGGYSCGVINSALGDDSGSDEVSMFMDVLGSLEQVGEFAENFSKISSEQHQSVSKLAECVSSLTQCLIEETKQRSKSEKALIATNRELLKLLKEKKEDKEG